MQRATLPLGAAGGWDALEEGGTGCFAGWYAGTSATISIDMTTGVSVDCGAAAACMGAGVSVACGATAACAGSEVSDPAEVCDPLESWDPLGACEVAVAAPAGDSEGTSEGP